MKKVQETAITKAESGYMEERNTLNEELAKWKSAYHKLKADATQKMQEFQDQQLEAAAAERAQLRVCPYFTLPSTDPNDLWHHQ